METGERGRHVLERRVAVEWPLDRDRLGLVAEDADLLAADQLGSGGGCAFEELLEPVRRRPIVGVLEQVGVVVGVVDDLLDEPVRADILGRVQQGDLGMPADELDRRAVGCVVDDDDPVRRPRLGDERGECVVEPLLALEVRDEHEHRRVGTERVPRRAAHDLARSLHADADVVQQPAENALGVEVLLRDLRCGATLLGQSAATSWTASVASASFRNEKSPAPVGRTSPNPVSCVITGRPAAR